MKKKNLQNDNFYQRLKVYSYYSELRETLSDISEDCGTFNAPEDGIVWEIAKNHIENSFKEGMTWANYGEWHIDHIVPLASAKNKQDLYKLCNYKNLQPLWALENRKKGAKL